MNISIHSMLTKYVLAHVSVVSAFFMAACKDSSSSLWMLASVNLCVGGGGYVRTGDWFEWL